jgi:hypothetical protein
MKKLPHRTYLVEYFELAAANAAKQVAQQHEVVDRIAHRAHPAQRGRYELHHVVTQHVLRGGVKVGEWVECVEEER